MSDTPSGSGGFFSVNESGDKIEIYKNGELVRSYIKMPAPPNARPRHAPTLNPALLAGPKLKVERAKCHIQDLQAAIGAFHDATPYSITHHIDSDAGEHVYRVHVKERIPIKLSAILGDILHNLRTALDHLVCDLIRANGCQPDGNSGFPIHDKPKGLKPGSISKIKGVKPKAERLILRLKPYKTGCRALWELHRLDVLDKHNGIIPVAAATIQIMVKTGLPGVFIGPKGTITLGGGGQPLMAGPAAPEGFRPIPLLKDDVEVYRSPLGFEEQIDISLGVTFGQGQIVEGQPVVETLQQYADLIERILGIFEKHAL